MIQPSGCLLELTETARRLLRFRQTSNWRRAMAELKTKVSKAEALYQDEPRAGEKCEACVHFIPEQSACEVVAGSISPQGWSKYFEPA